MSSTKELTGGSGDVNPNMFVVNGLQQAGADQAVLTTVTLPVIRACQTCPKGKAYAFELLWIKVGATPGIAFPVGIADQHQQWLIGVGTDVPDPSSSTTFYLKVFNLFGGTAVSNNANVESRFTDEAGHGLIITNAQITMQYNTVQWSGLQTPFYRFFYRWKLVDIAELITSQL